MTDSEERVEFPSGLGLTFEEAIADESNVLEKIRCSREVLEFKQSLASQSSTLESLVAHHLGLRSGISAHQFYPNARRSGPFVFQLTDLHPGNFLVDDDCNITAIVDLEWMVSHPVDMLALPSCRPQWEEPFAVIYDYFMNLFEEEERLMDTLELETALDRVTLSSIMRETLDTRRYWFNYSLSSVDAMYLLTQFRLFPMFNFPIVPATVYPAPLLWAPDANQLVAKKLRDREEYLAKIAALYGKAPPPVKPEPEAADPKERREMREAMRSILKYMGAEDDELNERITSQVRKQGDRDD
ncbi:hypothetical protein SAPIO_CDS8408 [Scedosporium apiospermum]|uniref:Aminoglycoside phosphotransferase domain-containing protein n=1 Tax=Pseudallescheria apiosperma TaxID=563466 RepID=A0A084FZJ8_PSEDA|nr:uncharacterized protein SAPIO_CDS8408 [Scedosporium apiospermum]KEZ40510.1 hypothetical protein SAPIO_CDS8408 [Scedosporium apiospermum]